MINNSDMSAAIGAILTQGLAPTGVTPDQVVRGLRLDDEQVLHLILDAADAGISMADLTPVAEDLRTNLAELEGISRVDLVLAAPSDLAPEPTSPTGPQALPGVRHVILVGSGKGGVGKSTVSANLALALADQGLSVGLLDADIYGPSLPRMLGASEGRPVARNETLIPISAQGIKVMSVGFLFGEDRALVWRAPILVNALRQMLFEVDWAPLDVLVIDLPPGTGDVQITLAQQIHVTGALVVTTPQDIALLDARRAIDLFDQVETPVLGLIENMSVHVCSNCGQHDPVFGEGGGRAEAEARGIAFLGALPLDRRTRESGDSGLPILRADPSGPAACAFHELAGMLADVMEEISDPARS